VAKAKVDDWCFYVLRHNDRLYADVVVTRDIDWVRALHGVRVSPRCAADQTTSPVVTTQSHTHLHVCTATKWKSVTLHINFNVQLHYEFDYSVCTKDSNTNMYTPSAAEWLLLLINFTIFITRIKSFLLLESRNAAVHSQSRDLKVVTTATKWWSQVKFVDDSSSH